MKKILFCFLTVLIMLEVKVYAVPNTCDNLNIDGYYNNTPLIEIFKNFADDTGCDIEVPEEWLTMPVSGNFDQLSLHDFFKKILKNNNFSLIFDDQKKVVVVKNLGNSTGNLQVLTKTGNPEIADVSNLEPGAPEKELQVMQDQQLKEMQQYRSNPKAIDPISGMTYGHIKELHRKQIAERDRDIQNGKAVDHLSNISINELKRLN